MNRLVLWWRKAVGSFCGLFNPYLTVRQIEGDTLPKSFPKNQLIYLIDDGEGWSAGLHCPCGCGDILEVPLLHDASPKWRLNIDSKGRPTLHPSIWRREKCRSHFWIRGGRVYWC
ncbi:DUF6527 family protein [Stutzerimonas kunmingensis]|uniref:DUF6527 family protein n=1 Tax=Stutzerimonas kunmingensis TaxID=1211807 RepID=UPI00339CADD2